MPGSGTYTLHRLIHSPGTIAFYSPEPINLGRREGNCKLGGWMCVLKLENRSYKDVSCILDRGTSIVFTGFTGTTEVFWAKIPSQHVVWLHSAEVDALFRLSTSKILTVEGQLFFLRTLSNACRNTL